MGSSVRPWATVVIPIKDERDNVLPLVKQLLAVLASREESRSASFEILFVDDGSTDGSGALLDDLATQHGQVTVLHFDRNYGKTAALDAGFRQARGELVVIMDGDLQNDTADIGTLIPYLAQYDVVCGWRTGRQDHLVRKISSRIANCVRNAVIHDGVHDTGCGFMAFRRAVIEALPLFEGMHRFFPALALMHGFTVTEVPIRHHPRVHGVSKYGVGNRLFKGLSDLMAVRWMKSRCMRYRCRDEVGSARNSFPLLESRVILRPSMTASTKASHLLLLVALACLLFIWGLGSIGLTDRDEGRNAEAGREMFETGDWITPTFNYEPRFIKPAMLYWLMSVSYSVFGENEFAARFPSALFGVALIVLQYLFLLRVCGQTIAWFGALMLLVNVATVCLARVALTDMVLIFFTTLATFSFWLGFHGTARQRPWLGLTYVAMACGTLTKGPVGVLVPMLAIVPYVTVTRQWRRFWQHGLPVAGPVLFLMVTLPWYATMLMLHGSAYSSDAQLHTVTRFLNPFYGWGGTILFYLPVLLWGFFPWSAFVPVALHQAFKSWRETRGMRLEGGNTSDLELFAGLWFLTVLIFFSLGATRLPHYIGPIYPSAAIIAACFWTRTIRGPATPGLRGALSLMIALGTILALLFAALPLAFDGFAGKLAKSFPHATQFHLDLSPYVVASVVLLGMALVGWWGFSDSRRVRVFWVAGGTTAVVILIVLNVMLPQLSRYFLAPPQELASAAGLQLRPTDHLIIYGLNRPSVVFYAQRKVIVVHKNEEDNIRPYLQSPHSTMIILPAQLRDKLPREASGLPIVQERFGWILVAQEREE